MVWWFLAGGGEDSKKPSCVAADSEFFSGLKRITLGPVINLYAESLHETNPKSVSAQGA